MRCGPMRKKLRQASMLPTNGRVRRNAQADLREEATKPVPDQAELVWRTRLGGFQPVDGVFSCMAETRSGQTTLNETVNAPRYNRETMPPRRIIV